MASLQRLNEHYPTLYGILFDQQGVLNPYINVYLNQQDIRASEEQTLSPGDEVTILTSLVGG